MYSRYEIRSSFLTSGHICIVNCGSAEELGDSVYMVLVLAFIQDVAELGMLGRTGIFLCYFRDR